MPNPSVSLEADLSKTILTRRLFAASGLATGMLLATGHAAPNLDVAPTLNEFGRNLFLRQLTDAKRNAMLSPLSLGLCTAMVAAGSAGKTAAEFEAVLSLRPEAFALLSDASYALSQKLKMAAGLSLANALALESTPAELEPAYVALVRAKFGGEILAPATADSVNAWVLEKTHGMIPHLVQSVGACVLVNALYFKGAWPKRADEATPGVFVTGQGETIRVPRMEKECDCSLVLQNAQTFVLPYKSSTVAMVVVLPAPGMPAAQLARDLRPDAVRTILDNSDHSTFDSCSLLMPPFKIDADLNMAVPFSEAGLRTMFDSRAADLSGIAPRLFVESIRHRCVIDVTRYGTEAAAATATEFGFSGGAIVDSVRPPVVVDRPFLFYLVDKSTQAILMQGCVNDPRSADT